MFCKSTLPNEATELAVGLLLNESGRYFYAEFDDIDGDDQNRLMNIAARGGNRDGVALSFVAERLSKRPESFKMLILVSDGQPSDIGCSGSVAEEDLLGVKRKYERKGVLFVAAIGDDTESIERIYEDALMDFTDLGRLPFALAKAIKRHIKI
ncbi:MAG: hypothetical protein LBU32_11025 [Clostridiales bacterium]|jgi:nitric oxide reductase activation protein|nr:hypothetical protein [Clostridiales bacterium]